MIKKSKQLAGNTFYCLIICVYVRNLSVYKNGTEVYNEFVRKSQTSHACALCDRSFCEEELNQFLEKVRCLAWLRLGFNILAFEIDDILS